jgi:hypothetical protein
MSWNGASRRGERGQVVFAESRECKRGSTQDCWRPVEDETDSLRRLTLQMGPEVAY